MLFSNHKTIFHTLVPSVAKSLSSDNTFFEVIALKSDDFQAFV